MVTAIRPPPWVRSLEVVGVRDLEDAGQREGQAGEDVGRDASLSGERCHLPHHALALADGRSDGLQDLCEVAAGLLVNGHRRGDPLHIGALHAGGQVAHGVGEIPPEASLEEHALELGASGFLGFLGHGVEGLGHAVATAEGAGEQLQDVGQEGGERGPALAALHVHHGTSGEHREAGEDRRQQRSSDGQPDQCQHRCAREDESDELPGPHGDVGGVEGRLQRSALAVALEKLLDGGDGALAGLGDRPPLARNAQTALADANRWKGDEHEREQRHEDDPATDPHRRGGGRAGRRRRRA